MRTASEIAQEAREDLIAGKIVEKQYMIQQARERVVCKQNSLDEAKKGLALAQAELSQFIKDVDAGLIFPVTDFAPQQ